MILKKIKRRLFFRKKVDAMVVFWWPKTTTDSGWIFWFVLAGKRFSKVLQVLQLFASWRLLRGKLNGQNFSQIFACCMTQRLYKKTTKTSVQMEFVTSWPVKKWTLSVLAFLYFYNCIKPSYSHASYFFYLK